MCKAADDSIPKELNLKLVQAKCGFPTLESLIYTDLTLFYRCHTEYETVHDTKYHPKVNLEFQYLSTDCAETKTFLTTIFPSAILRTSQSATRTMQQSTMKSVRR